MRKRINYKGKVYVEYRQPILKSWMLSILAGGVLFIDFWKWYFELIKFAFVVLILFAVQSMYERELKDFANKEKKE